MESLYMIGLGGIFLTFFLMIALAIYIVRDQAKLCYRQEQLEKSVRTELDALRARVKEVNDAEKQQQSETAVKP